jgi:Zn-dependent protease with chaperone function
MAGQSRATKFEREPQRGLCIGGLRVRVCGRAGSDSRAQAAEVNGSYAPPSALFRAMVSLVLLLGFYCVVLGLAGVLLTLPIVLLLVLGRTTLFTLLSFLFCWTPALVLVKSTLSTRRPDFTPPGRQLAQAEAPALFAMVEELANRAGTAAPSEIYLDCLPNLAVTEVGGLFRSRRVMIVGAPLTGFLSVEQLRSGVAHELGHFAGGDTRLTGFSTQTHTLFASVVETVQRDPFRVGTRHYAIEAGLAFAQVVGHTLVEAYARLFLRLTMPISRRQELAADALSATLVGAPVAASALERTSVDSPLYLDYLNIEVGYAIRHGFMPSDLAAGFTRFRDRFLDSDAGRTFVATVRASTTDPYDTHPALTERLRALESFPNVVGEGDDNRPAALLFGDQRAFDAWLLQATRERVVAAVLASGGKLGVLRELPWTEIHAEAHAPRAREAARELAARLYPSFSEASTIGRMFAAAFRCLLNDGPLTLAALVNPALRGAPLEQAEQVALGTCNGALGVLLQGALLESGAVVEDSLGSPFLVFRLENEQIDVAKTLASFAARDDAARASLERWARALGSAS